MPIRTSLALFLLSTSAVPALAQEGGDWPSYNRTLTSERMSPLAEITRENVANLKEICSYDLGRQTSFQTGPIVTGGTLYLTTDFDTVALDPATCAEKWKVTEDYEPSSTLSVNRGAAVADGRLFRGTQDGRVLAYDAATGDRLWERQLGYPDLGESVPAAPIVWEGLVFAGNAGGDKKGVKGRMYALDAATGEITWEFFLVPKGPNDLSRGPSAPDTPELQAALAGTWGNESQPISGGATWASYTLDPDTGELYVSGGNPAPDFAPQYRPGDNLFANSIVVLDARTGVYKRHMPMVPRDFHDWDVAAATALFTSRGGRDLMATAPKDGHLYINDRATGERLFRTPVTTIENVEAPITPEGTRFCPGSQGGTEWNGPAYSPDTNLVYTGAVDWCTIVHLAPPEEIEGTPLGADWSGNVGGTFGEFDPPGQWAGWLYATDPDSGETRWRHEMEAPILAAVTPTAGGLVFTADMAGNLVALDAESGDELWTTNTGGAVGGGIISYSAGGPQRIAVASGMVSGIWPAPKVNAKLIVYGLE